MLYIKYTSMKKRVFAGPSFFSNPQWSRVKVKVTQSLSTLRDPIDYTVHGILKAKILEWVFLFSRGSSQPRSPALQADSLPAEPQRKPQGKPKTQEKKGATPWKGLESQAITWKITVNRTLLEQEQNLYHINPWRFRSSFVPGTSCTLINQLLICLNHHSEVNKHWIWKTMKVKSIQSSSLPNCFFYRWQFS